MNVLGKGPSDDQEDNMRIYSTEPERVGSYCEYPTSFRDAYDAS